MTPAHLTLPPPKDYGAAKRQFMELYGSTEVLNTYLRIAVLALSAVCLGLVILNVKAFRALQNVKPVIVRIHENGRTDALDSTALLYRPQEAEIKYFLIQFVQMHYGRMRATIRENFARSLYFVDGRLTTAIMEAEKKNKIIETLLSGQTEQIDIKVTSVAIEDLRSAPYRATIDFEKIYSGADRQETKREKYVGNFVFTLKDRVPHAMVPVNPLGLTITYFREDQTFE